MVWVAFTGRLMLVQDSHLKSWEPASQSTLPSLLKELRVLLVSRVLKDHKVFRVLLDLRVLRDHRVPQVLRVLLDHRVQQDHKVLQDLRVLQVLQVLKV